LKVRTVDGLFVRHEKEWPLARTDWTPLTLNLSRLGLGGEGDSNIQEISFKARSGGACRA
jgi:hypothetical protein